MTRSMCIGGILLTLLVSSASWGWIANTQGFLDHGTNGAFLVGGPGASDSTNIQTVGQIQQDQDVSGLVRTVQTNNGGYVQAAGVGGIGSFLVDQDACLGAGQLQLHSGSPFGLGLNLQGGAIGFDQTVLKAPGASVGLAYGLQQAYLNQFQIIATPFGTNVNTNPVMASAFDAVGN